MKKKNPNRLNHRDRNDPEVIALFPKSKEIGGIHWRTRREIEFGGSEVELLRKEEIGQQSNKIIYRFFKIIGPTLTIQWSVSWLNAVGEVGGIVPPSKTKALELWGILTGA